MNAAAWLSETRAVYLDNATSKRDYRVQMRGNKSVVLFGLYLLTLITVALFVYGQTVRNDRMEVVEAQNSLKNFYGTVMNMLAGLVSLVAPALTATTIVVERQRRSLDLIFSAPVTPKYFLVGKMMSSFRYTWMLLVLSLPVTAACVVLGGASWVDVLTSYLCLSFQALIMTSIGLLLSTLTAKPISAVLWSYAASIAYLAVTASLTSVAIFSVFGATNNPEQPFVIALNPFFVQQSVGTYTTISGYGVPNWVLLAIFAILACKLCLLAAGSVLSPTPEKEIRSLRLHVLAYVGFFTYYGFGGLTRFPGSLARPEDQSHIAGVTLFWVLSPLFVFMPHLCCFGVDGERRHWPDGWFSTRRMLTGSPSSALPFLLAVIGVAGLAGAAGLNFDRSSGAGPNWLIYANWVFYTGAFWVAFWAIGRLASSFLAGLRPARIMQFASFLLLVVLPLPFLSAVTGTGPVAESANIWNLYPLRPVFLSTPGYDSLALGWAIGMSIFCVGIAAVAESSTRARLALLKEKHETVLVQA